VSAAASGRPKLGLVAFVVAPGIAAVQLGGCGVDGVTPDCSDAAVCAPSEGDASKTGDGSAVVPEAASPIDDASAAAEAGLGDADADADGG